MAAPVYATDLTDILVDFPNTTNWTALGGGASGLTAPETDYFVQGSNCISKAAWASAVKGMIYNSGSGITVPTDGAVIMWINHATMNSVDTQAGGGLRLLIGSGTGAYKEWFVGGSDTEIFGLHNPYPVDPTLSADATTGSPSSTLQYFGAQADLPSGGPTKGAPFAIDAMRYGRCRIDVSEGSLADGYATFAGLEAYGNASSRRWGLIEKIKGVFLMQGFLSLGISGTKVEFVDSDRAIYFRDTLKVGANFNRIEVMNSSTVVTWTRIQVTSLGTVSKPVFVVTAGTVTLNACQFIDCGAFTFLSTSDVLDCIFLRCGQITAPGTDMRGSIFNASTAAANASAVVWNVATDTDGLLDDCSWTKGANAHHAIELGTSSPTAVTFRNCSFSGFNASNGQNDSTFHVKRTTGSVTINVIGCSGNFSYRTDGATVSVVTDPVTTGITIKTQGGVAIQNARVRVEASDNSGDLPYDETVTITRSGTTATVSHTAHGMVNGDKVAIRGANQPEYNGVFVITNVSTNAYDYTVSGTPATPATGTIKATGVVLEGLTNASGYISASRSFTVDQNVRGVARKATSAPYYKSFDFTDVVDNVAGLAKTIQLVADE